MPGENRAKAGWDDSFCFYFLFVCWQDVFKDTLDVWTFYIQQNITGDLAIIPLGEQIWATTVIKDGLCSKSEM